MCLILDRYWGTSFNAPIKHDHSLCHTQMCITILRSSCSLQLQFTQHLQHLDEVFTRLCKAGLTAEPSKVAFAVQMVLFWATEYPIQVHRLSRSALGP